MLLGGIFVGGASRRMGSPKGLLVGPDGRTLVERARAELDSVCDEVVLVGRRPAYAHLDLEILDDRPAGVGPLGGLAALLARAAPHRALALACDMPGVTEGDLRALADSEGSAAPRRAGRWEPLCAVYDARALAVVRRHLAAGQRRLQRVLDELAPAVVPIEPAHLDDWDHPSDVTSS